MTYTVTGNFDSTVFPSTYFAQVFNFGTEHTSRVTKYQNCWDFYDGKHWTQVSPEGFDQVTINYAKAFVKKLRRFAFRNPWSMVFTEEQRTDGVDEWVTEVWKNNNLKKITNTVAEFGGIFGDWFIYPQWLPSPDNPDATVASAADVKLVALDPRYVFPQYNSKTGQMDFCVIMIPYNDVKFVGNELEIEPRVYREVHTPDKIYIQEFNEKNEVLEERVEDNPLGKILIVHGICQPKAGSYFGAGIIEDMIDGNKLFNEKTSDISDILDYHAAPITLVYGAKAKQLEKGANKIWSGLPANARVENLSSPGNIAEARDFVADVKAWMHEISSIPEESMGKERAISNTSATALAVDFEPLIELAEDVRFYFEDGIKRVNELIIDIGTYTNSVSTSIKPPLLYEVSLEQGALLPRDRSIDLADITTEINLGLESKKGAMARLGVKDVEAKMAEVRAEEEEDAALQFERDQKYNPIPDPLAEPVDAPNQFGKGEASTTEGKKARKAVNKNPAVHGDQVTAANTREKS